MAKPGPMESDAVFGPSETHIHQPDELRDHLRRLAQLKHGPRKDLTMHSTAEKDAQHTGQGLAHHQQGTTMAKPGPKPGSRQARTSGAQGGRSRPSLKRGPSKQGARHSVPKGKPKS